MLRNLFCMFVAAAWVTVLFPVACLVMGVTLNPSLSMWVARRFWSPVLLWAGGAKLVVHGQENVDPARPTIYVVNHQSTIDIPTTLISVPVNFRFVAKKQLQWVPFLGWYLKLAGHILINRSDHRAAVASLDQAVAQIRSGTSIVIFPEGTRSEDGRVLPFKKGPFALALKAQVAICPVTIEGSGKLMPKNSWRITPGEIHVMIGKPIDPHPFGPEDREKLMRVVRGQIIDQSLALGGKGGDREDAIAARGKEGIGQGKREGEGEIATT